MRPQSINGLTDLYHEPLDEQDARMLTTFRSYVRPPSDSRGHLKSELARIDGTALKDYEYAGFIPEGPARDGPWSNVTRVFIRPDGQPILINEWDFVVDGGSIKVVRDWLNETVGETPARLVVKRGADGTTATVLTWTTRAKDYTIMTPGDALSPVAGSPYDKAWLLSIAKGLSRRD